MGKKQHLIPFTLLVLSPAKVRNHPYLTAEGMVLCSNELENSVNQKVGAHLEGEKMGSGPCFKGSALSSNQMKQRKHRQCAGDNEMINDKHHK